MHNSTSFFALSFSRNTSEIEIRIIFVDLRQTAIEKLMGFYHLPKQSEISKPSEKKKIQTNFKSEFEKYEQNYFRKNPPPAKVQELKTLLILMKLHLNTMSI